MPENLNDWLGLVVPEETTNYVANPSFELDAALWTTTNTTLGRAGAYARMGGIGTSCLATNASNGFASGLLVTTTAIGHWTASAWMLATQACVLGIQNTGSGAILGSVAHPGDGKWHRISVTAMSVGAAIPLRVYTLNPLGAGWQVYYVDGFQLENKAYMTTYCDGDQNECSWLGPRGRSASRRTDNAKSGGRYRSFRDMGVNVRAIAGSGAPPMQHISDAYAVLPGAEYQQTAVQSRTITLTCQAIGGTREGLHVLRTTLLNAMARQGGKSNEPIWLCYQRDVDHVVQIGVYYEGGLEFGETVKWTEPFPIRLIAYDPYWQSEYDLSADIQGQSLLTGNGIAMRKFDQPSDTPSTWGWGLMNYTAGDNVSLIRVIETAPDGRIYVAGTFTQIGGVAANNIAFWDGVTWNAMGAGGISSDTVQCIAFGLNGEVYLGGSFTSAGGVGCTRFAQYNPATNTFIAVQNYTAGTVMCIAVRKEDGTVYIGGSMTRTIAGRTFTGLDAYTPIGTNSSKFDALSMNNSEGLGGIQVTGGGAIVNGMCFHGSNLYFCGNFTAITWYNVSIVVQPVVNFGFGAHNAGMWPLRSLTTLATYGSIGQAPIPLNTGLTNTFALNDMIESSDGRYVYMGGVMTTSVSGTTHGVVAWDGSSWSGNVVQGRIILSGWNSAQTQVLKLKNDPGGALWALGLITSMSSTLVLSLGAAGGYVGGAIWDWVQNVVRFNGSEWMPIDCMFYGGKGAGAGQHQYQLAMGFTPRGDMMIGPARQPTGIMRPGTVQTGTPITVDAPTPVKIVLINGAGETYLSRITNLSSGKELFFKNPSMVAWSRAEINTEIGKASFVMGLTRESPDYISGDSQLALFWLQPGENKMTFATMTASQATPHGTGALGFVYYRQRLLSMDSIPRDTV